MRGVTVGVGLAGTGGGVVTGGVVTGGVVTGGVVTGGVVTGGVVVSGGGGGVVVSGGGGGVVSITREGSVGSTGSAEATPNVNATRAAVAASPVAARDSGIRCMVDVHSPGASPAPPALTGQHPAVLRPA